MCVCVCVCVCVSECVCVCPIRSPGVHRTQANGAMAVHTRTSAKASSGR